MKLLLLFAHPRLEKSRTHIQLLKALPENSNITFFDLYENYPHFQIDVIEQQKLLLEHDFIIWQHPLYWYSCPPLLKQWIDMVLEFNWAYGPQGKMLQGKKVCSIISSGGTAEAYQTEGSNRFTIEEFLRPFEQTVRLCKMTYLPPFLIHGTHRLSNEQLQKEASTYADFLIQIAEQKIDFESWALHKNVNSYLTHNQAKI